MANTNPQAIRVVNEKVRPLADRFGQLYNLCKALQAEYLAENWGALFPADADTVSDGAEVDGRAIVTNQEIRDLMLTVASGFITTMEATSNAQRNLVLKIAVNPERI